MSVAKTATIDTSRGTIVADLFEIAPALIAELQK